MRVGLGYEKNQLNPKWEEGRFKVLHLFQKGLHVGGVGEAEQLCFIIIIIIIIKK